MELERCTRNRNTKTAYHYIIIQRAVQPFAMVSSRIINQHMVFLDHDHRFVCVSERIDSILEFEYSFYVYVYILLCCV